MIDAANPIVTLFIDALDVRFQMRQKSGKNHGAIFLKHFKRLHHVGCLFFPKININYGWGQFHLKPDIERSVLSTESVFRDISGLRYLKKNSELLPIINYQCKFAYCQNQR